MNEVNAIAEGYWQWLSGLQLWEERVRDPLLTEQGDVVDSNDRQLAAYIRHYVGGDVVERVGVAAKAGGLIHADDLGASDFDCGAHLIQKVVMESLRRSAFSNIIDDFRLGTLKTLDAPNMVEFEKYLAGWEEALRSRVRPGSLDGCDTYEQSGLQTDLRVILAELANGEEISAAKGVKP